MACRYINIHVQTHTHTDKHILTRKNHEIQIRLAASSRITLTSPDPSDTGPNNNPTVFNQSHIVTFSTRKHGTQTRVTIDAVSPVDELDASTDAPANRIRNDEL